MATCQEWTDWFGNVMRWQRGIGNEPPSAPAGRPPEGCTYAPCPGNTNIQAMVDALNSKLEERDNLNASRPPDCPQVNVRAVRVFNLGNVTPGFQCFAPAGGQCGPFTSTIFYSNAFDCEPPPAPVEPGPDVTEFVFTIDGGPWDGTTISNLAVGLPTIQGLQKGIDASACICQQLILLNARYDEILNGFQILLNLLGNLRDIGLQSQLTKNDHQQNVISLIGAIGSLSQVLDTRLKIHAVAVGGAEMDFPSEITNGVLNPADLQDIVIDTP